MLIFGCAEKQIDKGKIIPKLETKVAEEDAQKAKEERERQAAEAQRKADEAAKELGRAS